MNTKLIALGVALIAIGMMAFIPTKGPSIMFNNNSTALAISPYDSGYNHGEDDCQLKQNGDAQDMYILEPGKGPAYHTDAFMNGYYDGWNNEGCSSQEINDRLYPQVYSDNDNTAYDNSFNNRDSVVQPQSQSAVTAQSNSCPQLIVNGDCFTKQNQDVNNDFAQANRADN